MITEAFPKLENTAFVRLIRAFFRSAYYPALIALAMACSAVFALELAVIYFYLILGAIALLFAEDALGILPIACCGYMLIAPENNPARNYETIFGDSSFVLQFGFVMVAAVLLLLGRLALRLIQNPKRGYPRLLLGFLALGVAYMIGGILSPYYKGDTVLYGFVQIVSLAALYLYFRYAVDWESVPKWYVPATFLFVGIALLAQVGNMYTLPSVFWEDGSVDRSSLYVGWGVYNNIGCVLAMCIPAASYFSVKSRHGWVFTILSSLLLLGVCFTQSRGSILFGAITYAGCAVWVLVASKGATRWTNFIVYGGMAVGVLISALIFREQVKDVFASILEVEMESNGRLKIYRACWETFLGHPVFGVGFYATPGLATEGSAAFIAPRAHNTYLQLLASGGIFAMVTYLFHRMETGILLFKRPSNEKMFVFFVIAALLLTSLVDCNFFNIGPGILYGIVLAFAEAEDREIKERKMRERKA